MQPVNSRIHRHFLAVYDSRGFSAAAQKINITQPAITKSIQILEDQLGVSLFERTSTGATPTLYADILARRLRLMDIEYRYALSEIDVAKGGREGELRIGAGPAWYSTLLPPIIRNFLRKQPAVRIRIEAGVISSLIAGLEEGEFDLVCTSLDFSNRTNLVKEPVMLIRHSIVAAKTHPLAQLDVVDPASLSSFPWVTIADDPIGTGRILSYFAGFQCPPPKIMVETSSLTSMYALVAGGDFLAHMPQVMLPGANLQGIVPLQTEGTFWEAPTGIIYRQTQHKVRALEQMIAEVRSYAVSTLQESAGPGPHTSI